MAKRTLAEVLAQFVAWGTAWKAKAQAAEAKSGQPIPTTVPTTLN